MCSKGLSSLLECVTNTLVECLNFCMVIEKCFVEVAIIQYLKLSLIIELAQFKTL